MQTAIKQSYSEVNQIKMTQVEPTYWLRLLGDGNGVNGSAAFGHNGHSVELPALVVTHPEMLDHPSEYWLRLLGGTDQTNHAIKNGRITKIAPQALGNQQFTPEHWLRLLGDSRKSI